MLQLNPNHKKSIIKTPPQRNISKTDLSVLKILGDAYKRWHETLPHIPKLSRHTLGAKIDILFIETVEFILLAGYAPKNQKLSIIKRASSKLDTLKFFLQLAWEIRALEDKQYIAISTPLTESGKMLGGWQRQLQQETPAQA